MVDNFINNKIEIKNPKFENNSDIKMAEIFNVFNAYSLCLFSLVVSLLK